MASVTRFLFSAKAHPESRKAKLKKNACNEITGSMHPCIKAAHQPHVSKANRDHTRRCDLETRWPLGASDNLAWRHSAMALATRASST